MQSSCLVQETADQSCKVSEDTLSRLGRLVWVWNLAAQAVSGTVWIQRRDMIKHLKSRYPGHTYGNTE